MGSAVPPVLTKVCSDFNVDVRFLRLVNGGEPVGCAAGSPLASATAPLRSGFSAEARRKGVLECVVWICDTGGGGGNTPSSTLPPDDLPHLQ